MNDYLYVRLIMAAAALVLLTAACSGSRAPAGSVSSPPNASGASNSPSAIAYSHCIRAHGVPNFPDPPSNGQVPKADAGQLGVSNSRLQAAQAACQHLYPDSGGGVLTRDSLGQCEETGYCPQALVQQTMTALRTFARCVRAHGLPSWPDPTIDSENRPGFNLLHVQGFNPNSSQTDNVMQACYHVMRGVPVPVIRPGGHG